MYFLKNGNDGLGLCPAYGRHQSSLAAMGVTICDKGVKLTAAERRFVYGQVWTDVLRIEDVFPGVSELLPVPVIAEYFLILT